LVNLLSNAIKFTREGTISIKTDMVNNNNGELVISITDDGTGIDPAIMSRLFTKGLDGNMMTEDMGFNEDSNFPSDSFNPFSLLSSMQIGSSSLTNADWSVPQTVTMNLVGGNYNQEQQQQSNSANNTSAADLLFVSVIPYTGSDSNSISP
jgi:hypothetical protein